MNRAVALIAVASICAACAAHPAAVQQPTPQPPATSAPVVVPPSASPTLAEQCAQNGGAHCLAPADNVALHDSATAAYARGEIALRATGVDRFAAAHPAWNGAGVLIAILDSGLDPGVPGLATTTAGGPKILDLRDFSGEGRVSLHRLVRRGDTLVVGTHRLGGATHVAALAGAGAIWGGELIERTLGQAPAADLNGNGNIDDSLPMVVARTPDGWALFVDTEGDGTLAHAEPIHDFAVAHQFFGWHPRTPHTLERLPTPVDLAANLADSAGVPQLDLFFDTSSHGTHVAGIAAGHDLYGVAGFDGVAPGANLIGAKIANDADGAVTVTGSMVRALDYVIRFAHDRGMPLVVSMSFGVGNEVEGTARIDQLIDSVLAAHPDVPMTIAAGNDGPGLSTIGMPGSAARVISVGATLPLLFGGLPASTTLADPVASFSSRGGELAAPDIVTPGMAFSTVPNFARGQETEAGTSMATPYAAGLLARLVSALHASHRTASAVMLRQALRVSARALPSGHVVDLGAGLPDLFRAWQWLDQPHDLPTIAVDVGQVMGRGGVLLTVPLGAAKGGVGARVTLRRTDTAATLVVRLHAPAAWLRIPETVVLDHGRSTFTAAIASEALSSPGESTTAIVVEGQDSTAGPLAVIPVTVRVAFPATGPVTPDTVSPPPGGTGRVFVAADSGRGLQVQVATLHADERVEASLQEPGGMPFRDGASVVAGFAEGAGLYDVGAQDVVAGVYEVDAIASPVASSSATITVHTAPVRLGATFMHDTLHVTARNLTARPVPVRLRAGLVGAEHDTTLTRRSDAPVRLVLPVPAWVTHVIVDTHMPRDQWSRFTDFGLMFLDHHDRQFNAAPINYAFSRASFDPPDSIIGDSMVIVLSPAFADPEGPHDWTMTLNVRYYVGKPYSLDGGGSPMRPIAAAAVREDRFVQAPLPIALSTGFTPLITVVALEGEDRIWTREVMLPEWLAPR